MSVERLVAQAAKEDLATYIAYVHQTNEGLAAIPPRHIRDILIPTLMDDTLGHTVIVAPPDSAKTTVMIAYASWLLGRKPNTHIGYISGTAQQAYKRSVAVRDTIAYNDRYQKVFPGVVPDRSKGWAQDEWYLQRSDPGDKDASLLAMGTGGPILGARIDFGILDDIADSDNMATKLQQDKVLDWIKRTFMTRITPNGRVVMICTRWSENDPAAWAIEQGWHQIVLPALDSEGESYWPERWPTYKLRCKDDVHPETPHCYTDPIIGPTRCKKRSMGSRDFAQQYMGVVIDDESSIIKRKWWNNRYTLIPPAAKGGIFVDTAHTEADHADYSALLVARTDGVKVYIQEVIRAQVEFPQLKRMCIDAMSKYDLPIYIEDTTAARPLIQDLRMTMPRVMPWKIEGRSKLARVESVLAFIEAGDVLLPEKAPWVQDFIDECASFPLGMHDDQVDTLTMALLGLARRSMKWGPA